MTPEGKAALLYFATKYEAAVEEREERPPPDIERDQREQVDVPLWRLLGQMSLLD